MNLPQGWEVVRKHRATQFSPFEGYEDCPCVAVNKAGFTLSRTFCRTFGFRPGAAVVVLYNPTTCCVGLKLAVTQEEQEASYPVTTTSHGAKKSAAAKVAANGEYVTCSVACSSFMKRRIDPMFVGKLYQAGVAGGSSIVSFCLTDPLN